MAWVCTASTLRKGQPTSPSQKADWSWVFARTSWSEEQSGSLHQPQYFRCQSPPSWRSNQRWNCCQCSPNGLETRWYPNNSQPTCDPQSPRSWCKSRSWNRHRKTQSSHVVNRASYQTGRARCSSFAALICSLWTWWSLQSSPARPASPTNRATSNPTFGSALKSFPCSPPPSTSVFLSYEISLVLSQIAGRSSLRRRRTQQWLSLWICSNAEREDVPCFHHFRHVLFYTQ